MAKLPWSANAARIPSMRLSEGQSFSGNSISVMAFAHSHAGCDRLRPLGQCVCFIHLVPDGRMHGADCHDVSASHGQCLLGDLCCFLNLCTHAQSSEGDKAGKAAVPAQSMNGGQERFNAFFFFFGSPILCHLSLDDVTSISATLGDLMPTNDCQDWECPPSSGTSA